MREPRVDSIISFTYLPSFPIVRRRWVSCGEHLTEGASGGWGRLGDEVAAGHWR
jgi:hypothetical protein